MSCTHERYLRSLRMHPRNRYNDKPDFGELADFHPALKPFLIQTSKTTPSPDIDHPQPSSSTSLLQEGASPVGKPPVKPKRFSYTLDFSDPKALRELTRAVLERDFNLSVHLPLDKLIPAVPQRLNYIHWVEDLLGLCEGGDGGVSVTSEGGVQGVGSDGAASSMIGVDIGTGASCIYPLLGARMNGWRFLATDIDKESVKIARENVTKNGLADKVKVTEVSPDVVLEKALDPSVPHYSFCMCNPPFFKDSEERLGGVASHGGRRPLAGTYSSASVKESITEGGEVEFVTRIIEDSLSLRTRVRWYTSMLGKKSSMKVLLAELRTRDVPVVTTTEFVQGKTWRWGIGWSFDPTLKEKVATLNTNMRKRRVQSSLCLRLSLGGLIMSPGEATQRKRLEIAKHWLMGQFKELEMKFSLLSEDLDSSEPAVKFSCIAVKNTWSHQRRRKRILERLERQKKELRGSTSPEANEVTRSIVQDHAHQLSSEASEGLLNKDGSKLDVETIEHKAMCELESLSTPCHIEFTCSLMFTTIRENSPKKRKSSVKKAHKTSSPGKPSMAASVDPRDEESQVCAELEWVEGEDKDTLHQILQYLQNKTSQLECK